MKKTISYYDFKKEFMEVRPNNFSIDGLVALFNYIEELESDTGEEVEFDVISLCCDFEENNLGCILESYNLSSLDELYENTTVILVDDGLRDNDLDKTIIYSPY